MAGPQAMAIRFVRDAGSDDDPGKAQRFRDAALPYLDDAYTLARYLLRDASDAEDAVQECYLRALETFRQLSRTRDEALAVRDPAQCLPRRIRAARGFADRRLDEMPDDAEQTPLWHEAAGNAGGAIAARARRLRDPALVDALAEPFRETFVLREIHNLSYREIADIVEAPVGTVMSRLARARAMLRPAWTGGRGATT